MICSHHITCLDFDDTDILKQKLLGDIYKLRTPQLKLGMILIIFVLNNDKNSDASRRDLKFLVIPILLLKICAFIKLNISFTMNVPAEFIFIYYVFRYSLSLYEHKIFSRVI